MEVGTKSGPYDEREGGIIHWGGSLDWKFLPQNGTVDARIDGNSTNFFFELN